VPVETCAEIVDDMLAASLANQQSETICGAILLRKKRARASSVARALVSVLMKRLSSREDGHFDS
jgi:hypothetical protein